MITFFSLGRSSISLFDNLRAPSGPVGRFDHRVDPLCVLDLRRDDAACLSDDVMCSVSETDLHF